MTSADRPPTSSDTPSTKSPAVTLADFQQLIRRMYLEKDLARGIDGTFMWLMEEVGELAAALRNGTHEERTAEFADVLAWLATIANVAGVDLSQAVMQKYGAGCPGCGRFGALVRMRENHDEIVGSGLNFGSLIKPRPVVATWRMRTCGTSNDRDHRSRLYEPMLEVNARSPVATVATALTLALSRRERGLVAPCVVLLLLFLLPPLPCLPRPRNLERPKSSACGWGSPGGTRWACGRPCK